MGFTDETEIESIPGAKAVSVDLHTGEIDDKISKEQALELKTLLDYCSDDYVKNIKAVLAQPPHNVTAFNDIPKSLYEKIKLGAIKNATSALPQDIEIELQPQQQG